MEHCSLTYYSYIPREKEKMREREEAWQHIKDLAVKNPLFDKYSSDSNNIFSPHSSLMMSPQDDNDIDFNAENNGSDNTEVSAKAFLTVLNTIG